MLCQSLSSPFNELKTSKLAPTSALADKLISHSASLEPSDMADAHQKVHLRPLQILQMYLHNVRADDLVRLLFDSD